MSVYIIAEAGVNHNGCLDLAFRLCDKAKEAGANAVKFQTWKTERIVTKSAALAAYQAQNIRLINASQFEMLKKLELSYEQFAKIQSYCNDIGIDFLSTPDEEESLAFLMSLNLPVIKVGSGEVTNIPYLRKIGSYKKPVILSTGMSYISDVDIALRTLQGAGAENVTLLHCTTNYPCPMGEVNLCAMQTLKFTFKCNVGYSDHTEGIEVPIAAVAMGAKIIEKHFTLDKAMEGPDHKASLNPAELKIMVNAIRNVEKALGDGIKRPNFSEKKNSSVVLKRIVAKSTISIGDTFSDENLTVKRTDMGVSAKEWDMVIGRKAYKNYSIDEPIVL